MTMVNSGLKGLRVHPSMKSQIFFHGTNGLAIWQSFPDTTHIKVNNNGRKSAILDLIKLTFFRAYPSLKPHTLFHSNGLTIWQGLPNIRHIKVN